VKFSVPKLIFIWGALFSATLFLTLKYDVHEQPTIQRPIEEDPDLRAAAGKMVWQRYGCNNCHRINGAGSKIGPDLTRVGVRRDKSWLNLQLINPKSHNSNSIMSGHFGIPDKEKQDLVDYLSGLRGTAE
jgi:cbb3-type cytochrome oxidase cytochrome c subunit